MWTQHNLLPHRDRSEAARRTYSLWAGAADGVIHHSRYSKQIALAFYRYPQGPALRDPPWPLGEPLPARPA